VATLPNWASSRRPVGTRLKRALGRRDDEQYEKVENNMSKCYTCELVSRRDSGVAPLWDSICRTKYWDIVHSYNTELPGWLVIVSRRHIGSIDEMSENEAVELGIMLRRVSIAIKQVTGCEKTYVLQFAEHPDHPHVHFHVVPRMINQPLGKRIHEHYGIFECS